MEATNCKTCAAGRHFYDAIYPLNDYCYECTSDSHCGSNQRCSKPYTSAYKCVAKCHSTCATCDGTGSASCKTCPTGRYLYRGKAGTYCSVCTSTSGCTSNQVCDIPILYGSNKCVAKPTCHSTCGTCDGPGRDDCKTCATGLHLYDAIYPLNDYCYECTSDYHCASNQVCSKPYTSAYKCVAKPTCHSTCATCDSTGSDDCKTCPVGRHLYRGATGKWCYECASHGDCDYNQRCDKPTMFGAHKCVAMSDNCKSDADCGGTDICDRSLFTSNVCKPEAKVKSCSTSCISCCAKDAWKAGSTAVKKLGATAVNAASAFIEKSAEAAEDVLKDLSAIDVASIVPDLVKQLHEGANVRAQLYDYCGTCYSD